jgi:GNAT superfamily N-acetyltransferase
VTIEAARPAGTDDLEALVHLADTAIAELREEKGGELWFQRHARPQPLDASLRASLVDERQHVVVGTIDDTVIGYGVVRIEPLADERSLAVVDDLYVLPGARGVGVGEEMMDQLIAWSRAAGAVGIDSLALPGMRGTKNFFERFGLVARAILVHRSFSVATEDVGAGEHP